MATQLAQRGRVFGLRAELGRWGFAAPGLAINLCLGAVYAYRAFNTPLMNEWGISATASGLAFMVFLAMFAVGMAATGPSLVRHGPAAGEPRRWHLVDLGGLLLGFAPNIDALTLFYGGLAGGGVGVLYGCPLATSTHWFPDRRRLAVGLRVLGFGISPPVTALPRSLSPSTD